MCVCIHIYIYIYIYTYTLTACMGDVRMLRQTHVTTRADRASHLSDADPVIIMECNTSQTH